MGNATREGVFNHTIFLHYGHHLHAIHPYGGTASKRSSYAVAPNTSAFEWILPNVHLCVYVIASIHQKTCFNSFYMYWFRSLFIAALFPSLVAIFSCASIVHAGIQSNKNDKNDKAQRTLSIDKWQKKLLLQTFFSDFHLEFSFKRMPEYSISSGSAIPTALFPATMFAMKVYSILYASIPDDVFSFHVFMLWFPLQNIEKSALFSMRLIRKGYIRMRYTHIFQKCVCIAIVFCILDEIISTLHTHNKIWTIDDGRWLYSSFFVVASCSKRMSWWKCLTKYRT